MGKKKNRKKRSRWVPPEGAREYFSIASDEEFRQRHPVGYFFLVMLGITVLLLPAMLYSYFLFPYGADSGWLALGWIGAFIVGIGLFNFVAIIIRQYLGHLVSILSFLIGGILIWISLVQMGIV